ncbi:MAG: putative Ig domain-containing protein, partial [Bdellovibrionota bacterium]|nr:putative Ig domain-containing protein [Bdellovibrionota bacterium]
KDNKFVECKDSFRGLTFDNDTGELNWITDYFLSGVYNFKISAEDNDPLNPLSDTKEFNVTIKNVNRPPKLGEIDNQTIDENKNIKVIDVSDISKILIPNKIKLSDQDIDIQNIKYTCFYDQVKDSKVDDKNECINLKGISFDKNKGILNWIPNFEQSGTYEFKILGTDVDPNPKNDFKIFTIEVQNVNRPPKLKKIISIVNMEGKTLDTINASDENTNQDKDIDNDLIQYNCFYDSSVDSKVEESDSNNCLKLGGAKFDSTKGELNWTPSFFQAGEYEFKIVGSDGGNILLDNGKKITSRDDTIFDIKIRNVNRAPKLSKITDQSIAEGSPMKAINIEGEVIGDQDIDKESLIYSCEVNNNPCENLLISFNNKTGEIEWTPDFDQAGSYNFIISASDSNSNNLGVKELGDKKFETLTNSISFQINVGNNNRAPVLAEIKPQTVIENDTLNLDINTDLGNDLDIDGEKVTYECF